MHVLRPWQFCGFLNGAIQHYLGLPRSACASQAYCQACHQYCGTSGARGGDRQAQQQGPDVNRL
jgi:hypothetical protein